MSEVFIFEKCTLVVCA